MTNIHELIRHLNHGQRQSDGTTMLVGRHAVTEAIRLLNLLGETEYSLAAKDRCVQRVMERLSDLLNDDDFNTIERWVIEAGFPYPPISDPRATSTVDAAQ